MNENFDERKNLYDRFKNDVSKSSSSVFYDEEDLIEIFDYAGDVDDDFVRVEVLLCGARLYPESEALAVRRGYFYYSISNDEGVGAVVNSPHVPSVLWDILSLRVKNPDVDEARERLTEIVENTDEFDDESVIQLVDVASALGVYDWLKENKDLIQLKCSYPQTLLYEISVVAEIYSDFEFAASIIEQLTMIEPFNVLYWEMLAQEYLSYNNYDGALNAVDYALAIEPSSIRSLLMKAQILYDTGKNVDEAERLLCKVKTIDVDNSIAIQALAVIYINSGKEQEAMNMLLDYNCVHPEDKTTIDYLLALGCYSTDLLLQNFYNTEPEHSEDFWIDWAKSHAVAKRHIIAAAILECYDRNSGILKSGTLYYEQLYLAQCYDAVIALYNNDIKTNSGYLVSMEMGLIAVLSYMRKGEKQQAYSNACRLMLDFENSTNSVTYRLVEKGFMAIMKDIKNAIERGGEILLDYYDPFINIGCD